MLFISFRKKNYCNIIIIAIFIILKSTIQNTKLIQELVATSYWIIIYCMFGCLTTLTYLPILWISLFISSSLYVCPASLLINLILPLHFLTAFIIKSDLTFMFLFNMVVFPFQLVKSVFCLGQSFVYKMV